MSNSDRALQDLMAFDKMMRPPKPPIEDRFGVPAERLLEGITAKERQTILLCAVFFSANYDRNRVSNMTSSSDILREGLARGLDFRFAWAEMVDKIRTDPRYIAGDLIVDPVRGELFPDLTDEDMGKLCEDFRSYAGVIETRFARDRIFLHDHPIDTFVSIMASRILTIQAERVGMPWFGVDGREMEKQGLIRQVVANLAEPS